MHHITTMELIPVVGPIPPWNRLRIRLFLFLELPQNRLQKIWNRNTSNANGKIYIRNTEFA